MGKKRIWQSVNPLEAIVDVAKSPVASMAINAFAPGVGTAISTGANMLSAFIDGKNPMMQQPPMQMSNKARATANANPYGLSSGNTMANEKMTPGMDTKKFANGGALGGGDPKSKAAIKNLKKAAAEKPYYGGELPGVTVKGQIPEWLQISRQYEQMNPKQDFVKNYPKKQMGVRFSKKQKEEAYEKEKMRYVAENLIANKINRSAEEAANNNGNPIRPQFTDYEKQIIFNNSDPETLRMVFPEDVSWMQYNYPTWKDKGQAAMAVGQWIPGIGKVAKGVVDVAQPGLDFIEAYSLSGKEGVVDQAKQTAIENALFNLQMQQRSPGPFGKTSMLPVLPQTAQDIWETRHALPFEQRMMLGEDTDNPTFKQLYKHENGGMLKQYNAPTHEDGGQMIDGRGNPTTNPKKAVGEIEKKETSWNNYVFSDTLGENGRTFAQISKSIANRYKGKRDPLSKKTMEKEMKMLIQKNEAARIQKEQEEMAQMQQMQEQEAMMQQQMPMQQGQPQMSQDQMMQMMMQQQMMQQGQGQPMPQGMEQQMPQEGGEFRWGGGLDFPTYPYQNGGMLQVPEAPLDEYKKGGWIQKATASIKRRGTEGVCTGSKFGGPSCPPGSKRYNLAKTFKAMAKKHEDGGFIDSMPDLNLANYEMGGMLPEFGDGGYTVTRSSERKGKTHKVTGPDGTVKFFGDPDLKNNPSEKAKDAFYARHKKNLEGNPHFRAYARATWKNGGYMTQYPNGGNLPNFAINDLSNIAKKIAYEKWQNYLNENPADLDEPNPFPKLIPQPSTESLEEIAAKVQIPLEKPKNNSFPFGLDLGQFAQSVLNAKQQLEQRQQDYENFSQDNLPTVSYTSDREVIPTFNSENYIQANGIPVPQPQSFSDYLAAQGIEYTPTPDQPVATTPTGQPSAVSGTQLTDLGEDPLRLRPLEYASIGLKGLALGKSLYDALQPAEKEQLRLNREAGLVNNMMAGRNVNLAAALNEAMYNRNAALASNQARSANVQRALDMQTYTNAERNAIRAKLEERAMNNALRGEEANTRMNLGAMEAAERIRRQNIQSQNDAAQRDFGRQFFSDLSNVGNQLYKAQMYKDMYKNTRDMSFGKFKEAVAAINEASGGKWSYNDENLAEAWKLMQSGKYDFTQAIKFMEGASK